MKHFKIYSIVIVLLLTFSYFFFKTIEGPTFFVDVQLSKEAKTTLLNLKEKVKIIAYFDGDAKEGHRGHNAPFRDVYLGSVVKEVELGEIAHFQNIKFNEREFKKLKNNKYYITISTVSSRRTRKDNLLSCSHPVGLKSDFNNKRIIVTCKTISD